AERAKKIANHKKQSTVHDKYLRAPVRPTFLSAPQHRWLSAGEGYRGAGAWLPCSARNAATVGASDASSGLKRRAGSFISASNSWSV
ncbi:hypothetical protein, partial [Mesorhizobium sp.]|uniref:hypothetical protein n=1 Tax=Mesorhizobium sp. TaxID=1871066 RepID=UPI0025BE15AA